MTAGIHREYARYLMRKGISGTGYVVSGKWMLILREPAGTIR